MSAMEASLTAIHLHQAQQTNLLQKLVVAQTPSSTQIDDNKKGEKGSSEGEKLQIQITKVITFNYYLKAISYRQYRSDQCSSSQLKSS